LHFLVGNDCLTAQHPPAGVRHQPPHLDAFWPQQSAEPLAIKLCYTGSLLTYLAAGMHSSCAAALACECYLPVYKLHAFTFTMFTVKRVLSASKLASMFSLTVMLQGLLANQRHSKHSIFML